MSNTSFFDRLSGTETSKSAKRGHFRGYPKWPFWTPFGHPPFGTPWGPWRGYRRSPGGSWTRVLDHIWGVQYPHFMVPQMDAADLRGPFLIGSLVPRPQKVQKGVILGGTPNGPFWTPFGHPPFGTPWGPWRGWGHIGGPSGPPPIGPYRPSAPGPYRGGPKGPFGLYGQNGHLGS